MPDPTAEFAARLNDPAAWKINRAVPIFEAHETEFPEERDNSGKVIRPARKVKVTEADLEEICQNMIEDQHAGHYGMLTAGHLDPKKKETEQPDLFGFRLNPRIMPTGPDQKPRLVVDEYIIPDKYAERGKYPYRSADYYPGIQTIDSVALLKRRPRLRLGTFAYEDAERGECYRYAMGAMGPGNGTMPMTGGGASPPPETDEEKKLFEKFRDYLCRTYGLNKEWPAPAPETGMGGPPSDNRNPAIAAAGVNGEVTPMADDAKVLQYQAEVAQYKAEVEKLREADAKRAAELEGIRLERDQERCAALLYQLDVEQYKLTDEEKAKELKKLLATPAADRDERVKELRSIYAARKVPAGKVELYQGHVEGGTAASDPHKAPSYHEAAMAYMYAHPGTQYLAAVDIVKREAAKA